MFDAVTTLSQARKLTPRQIELLAGALGLHAVVAALLITTQLWSTEDVPTPDLVPAFLAPVEVLFTPTPPPPARPRPATPPAPVTAAAPPATPAPAAAPAQLATAAIPAAPGDGRVTAVGSIGTGDPSGVAATGSESAGGGDVAIAFGAGMVAPEVLLRIDPSYPELARQMRREGVVIVRAEIGRDGEVHDAQVAMAQPPGIGFEQAAMDAVRGWKFRPATLGGRPVAVLYHLTVRFRLR